MDPVMGRRGRKGDMEKLFFTYKNYVRAVM